MDTVPYAYVADLFDVLEKSAAEADASDREILKLRSEVASLRQARPVKRAAFTPVLIQKVAEFLEDEGLLPEGVSDSKQAAALLEENPDRLADLLLKLASPITPEGRPVKAASAPLSGDPKIITVGNNQLADHDGWAAAIR